MASRPSDDSVPSQYRPKRYSHERNSGEERGGTKLNFHGRPFYPTSGPFSRRDFLALTPPSVEQNNADDS